MRPSTLLLQMEWLHPHQVIFLTGGPLVALPTEPSFPLRVTYRKRWKLIQHLSHDQWQRWKNEYLLHLQKRFKWKKPSANLKPGDVVLLKDLNTFQRSWPLGKITREYKWTHELVNVADILINHKIYRRPVHKLVRLLGDSYCVSSTQLIFRHLCDLNILPPRRRCTF